MSDDDRILDGWSDADADAFFATIGKYIVIFQQIEAILDNILLIGWESSWTERHAALTSLTSEKKIDAVLDLVLHSADFSRARSRHDWVIHFQNIIQRLHGERVRRNKIIHSNYIFEFAQAGLAPPLRSKPNRRSHSDMFDQEFFSRNIQQRLLKDIGELYVVVGFVRVQLIADFRAELL